MVVAVVIGPIRVVTRAVVKTIQLVKVVVITILVEVMMNVSS